MPLAQTMPLLCPVNNVVEGFPVRDVEYDDNTSTTELPNGTRPNIQTSTDPQASNALVVGMANSKAALPSHVPNVHFGNPHAAKSANEKERKAEKNRKDMKRSPTLSELKAKTIKALAPLQCKFQAIQIEASELEIHSNST